MRSRHTLGILVLAALVCAVSAPGHAEPPAYNPDAPVTKPTPPKARNSSQEIRELLRPDRKIFEKARTLDNRTTENKKTLKALEKELKKRKAIVGKARAAYEKADAELKTARKMMHRRLRTMIQLKRIKPYSVLFDSDSLSTFLKKQRILKKIVGTDKARIEEFEKKLETLQALKVDLDQKEEWLSNRLQGMDNVRKELLTDAEVKEKLLQAVEMENSYYQELRKEVLASDKALRKIVRENEGDFRPLWFDERAGQHLWPIVNGDIPPDGQFGRRRHPKFGTVTIHRGISIVPRGWNGRTPVKVRSAYKGHVVYTGWVPHLGWTVLLDHTKGYMSVYGHLDKEIAVKTGERLERGQKIGLMSDSESLWGKRLYFEIRKDGRAVDPRPFLR
jgi:murein hydrolase activator